MIWWIDGKEVKKNLHRKVKHFGHATFLCKSWFEEGSYNFLCTLSFNILKIYMLIYSKFWFPLFRLDSRDFPYSPYQYVILFCIVHKKSLNSIGDQKKSKNIRNELYDSFMITAISRFPRMGKNPGIKLLSIIYIYGVLFNIQCTYEKFNQLLTFNTP